MRYRNLQHQIQQTKDNRYTVTIRGERRRWFWFKWRQFTDQVRVRGSWFWQTADVVSFHSRTLAERAAALVLERSESFTDDRIAAKYQQQRSA